MTEPYVDPLTAPLVQAAEYGVAKAIALGLISCDDAAVKTIAEGATKAVLDELASREEQCGEVTPRDEVSNVRDQYVIRASEYRAVVADIGGAA